MRSFVRIIQLIAEKIARYTMLLLIPMFGISLYEVLSRYFFNSPTTWAAPMISILFMAAVVPAGADLAARHGHVRMDVFYFEWSPRRQAIADLLAALVLFVFAGVLAWKAGQMAWTSVAYQETSWGVFRAPVYPKKIALAFGAFLLALEALALIIRGSCSIGEKQSSHG